jgi:hypothetical protein
MKRMAMAALLAASASMLAAADGKFEKTIPLPKNGEARLNWDRDRCKVLSVSLQNYPSSDDVDKARRDPSDKTWMWWNFHVENGGGRKCKIQLWVDVYDKGGNVVKAGDRSDTVSAGKYDDNIRVSTRMRTLDIVEAPRARLRAEIRPD